MFSDKMGDDAPGEATTRHSDDCGDGAGGINITRESIMWKRGGFEYSAALRDLRATRRAFLLCVQHVIWKEVRKQQEEEGNR